MFGLFLSLFNRNNTMESELPPSRSGHIAVLWNGAMYIWGGYNDSERSHSHINPRHLWKYDINHRKWSKLVIRDVHPSGRLGCCATCVRGKIIVFGGYGRMNDLNDVSVLNLKNLTWELKEPTGTKPSERNKTACCHYENRVIIFGGYGTQPEFDQIQNGEFHADESSPFFSRGWSNTLFAYDIQENEWITLPNTGDRPCPRAAHTFNAVDNKAYLFGGRHLGRRLGDLYMLCLDSFQWTSISHTSADIPIGRSWHSVTPISRNQLFLFGGFDEENNVLSDGWIYNCDENTWLQVRNGTYSRMWHSATPGSYPGQVLVFAGCENGIFEEAKHVGKLVVFDLQPKTLQRICLETLASNEKAWIKRSDCLPSNLLRMLSKLVGDGG